MSENKQPKPAAARPTGKRQLAGVSTTSTATYTKKNTPVRIDDEKPGGGVASFLPEVASEIRKVVWPTGKQMVTYTLVVFAFLITITVLVWGVDLLAGMGVEKVLTK